MKIGPIAFMAATLAASVPAMAEKLESTATHTYESSSYGTVFSAVFFNLAAGSYKLSLNLDGYGYGFSAVSAFLVPKSAGNTISSNQNNVTAGITPFASTNSQFKLFDLATAGEYRIAFDGSSFGAPGSSATATATLTNVTPVPGPEAGAGLGALALGGLALYMKRSQKEELAA